MGPLRAGKTVRALSDNMAVVHIINSKQSRNADVMHLIRCLTLIECAYDFVVVSKHLAGKQNWCVVTQPSVNVFISVPSGLSTPHSSAIITTPTCGLSEARLDLCKLGNSVRKYFHQGLASSTQRSYDSAKARFINFCSSAGSYPLSLSEHLLCFYVSFLADNGLAHSSIKCYLSAARHLYTNLSWVSWSQHRWHASS